MRFIHPQLFWLALPVLAAVIVLGVLATRRRKKMLGLLLGSRAESPGALRLSMAKRRWRRFFLAAAAFFLIAAAARPYWSTRRIPGGERGRDILVIFDVSKSMLATDLAPSRLDHAKFMLRELVRENRGDRFALVAFAGEAFLACPFTSDAGAFDQYVGELAPDLVPVGGTNLEKALRTALTAFRSAGGHRAIVIFTDGDELSGDSSRMIATLREQKIPIMVVGLGDPSTATPLPAEDGTLRRDRDGKVITSRLNEAALKRLAEENGGIYLRTSVADSGVARITARLQALERAENDGGAPKTVPVEKFPIALIAAAVALLFALLISETPCRRRAALWAAAAVVLLTSGAAQVQKTADAPKPAAVPELPAAAEKAPPTDPVERYNRALSLQRKGETAKAVPLYEGLLRDNRADAGIQSRALFNLAVAGHEPAREAFRAAEEEVRRQQLDAALRKLAESEAALKKAEELYMQSLASPEAAAFEESLRTNLEALTLDRRAVEALKKKIEELQKQQQKAREQAKQAQQQNRQQQQSQGQKQQQEQQQSQGQEQQQEQQQKQQPRQSQGQKQEQQQKQGQKQEQRQAQQSQGKKQDQQQSQQQDRQSQGQSDRTADARDAARELERQARELGQRKLADDAEAARRELEQAAGEQRRGDREKAQRHLDEAVKRLGEPRNGKEEKKPESAPRGEEKQPVKPEKPLSGEGEKKPLPAQPEQGKKADGGKPEEKRENAAEMVRLLDDEAKGLRDKLNRIRRSRRPAVEKDW